MALLSSEIRTTFGSQQAMYVIVIELVYVKRVATQ